MVSMTKKKEFFMMIFFWRQKEGKKFLTNDIHLIFLQADAALDMLKREYIHESLNYVLKIQEVQERIKFEFVEILLGFMSGWLVFYHLGHEVAEDAKEYMTDLQHKVQKVIIRFFFILFKNLELSI